MSSFLTTTRVRHAANSTGFSVVEVIVVASIVLMVVTSVAAAFFSAHVLARSTSDTVQANVLLDEAAEAIQLLRDTSWSTEIAAAPIDTLYYLVREPDGYSLSATPQYLGAYYVTISFAEVHRDGNGELDPSGTVDPSSREAAIGVYREADDTHILSGAIYVHDSHEN